MNMFISDRSKIEPTLQKFILYEEVATKLYFRLVGGNKSILPYWMQIIVYLGCTWIVNCQPPTKIMVRS